MFMSLFFLAITIITYVLSHFWARTTQPCKKFTAQTHYLFTGTQGDFYEYLYHWLSENKNIQLIKESDKQFILVEPSGWFSYGGFHHINLQENEVGLMVTISFQPKLVSTPMDEYFIQQKLLKDLKIEKVS